jgi:hypothetical protein
MHEKHIVVINKTSLTMSYDGGKARTIDTAGEGKVAWQVVVKNECYEIWINEKTYEIEIYRWLSGSRGITPAYKGLFDVRVE